MAGGQERILRGRIRSVQATKKITRAMELIAASRIVKAQQRVAAAVPYSHQITEVVKDLAAAGGSSQSPLLSGREEVKTTAYVVITADRGLCGGYNSGVQRATEGSVKADVLDGKSYALVTVGRKAEGYFKFRGYNIAASYGGFSDNSSTSPSSVIIGTVRRFGSPPRPDVAAHSNVWPFHGSLDALASPRNDFNASATNARATNATSATPTVLSVFHKLGLPL